MPTGIAAYFAAYIAFCLWAHHEDFTSKKSISWFGVVEVASNACLLVAASSFWLPPLRALPASVLLGLFVVGFVVFIAQGVLVARTSIQDRELPSSGKLFVIISGSALGAAITAPLLYWGWQSTVRSMYAKI